MALFTLSDDIIRTIIFRELNPNKFFDMKQNVHNFVNEANVYDHLVKYMKQALEYECERFTKCSESINSFMKDLYFSNSDIDILNDIDNLLMIITRVSTERVNEVGTENLDAVIDNIVRKLFRRQIYICRKIKIILLDITCKDVANIICDYILTH